MEKLNTSRLIGELQAVLSEQIEKAVQLRSLNEHELTTRPAADRWSVLEIAEHMNLSSGHYFKLLRKVYSDPKSRLRSKEYFVPGRFGEMGVKAMRPTQEGTINWKMRTLGIFEPRTVARKGTAALDELRSMLEGLHDLLEKARTRGMEGEKITSTLGPILRFKTGDAFRFPIAHQQRHFLQIHRTLEAIRSMHQRRA